MFSKHSKTLGHSNNESSFPGHLDFLKDMPSEVQCNSFAFGVILLEIISGRLPYCKDNGYLVRWVSRYEFPQPQRS